MYTQYTVTVYIYNDICIQSERICIYVYMYTEYVYRVSEQALLIAVGSRREYSIGHGNGVYVGGFPGKEDI